MTNNQLIPVFAGEVSGVSVNLVDARLLHSFLEVGRDFSNWIKDRIEEYGFLLNIDYLEFSPKLAKNTRGRPSKEYHLTLDTAKELSMVERNENGKQARRYFIDMERVALQSRYGLKSLEAPRAKKQIKGGLELHQQDAINDFIKQRLESVPQEKRAGMAIRMYSAITTKFGTKGMKDGYKNIDNIMQLIARLPLDEAQLPHASQTDADLLHVTPLELDALIQQRIEKVLEGEIELKADCPKYHYPLSDWQPQTKVSATAWLTFRELFRVEPGQRPTARLIKQHQAEGDDVSGVAAEVDALYLLVESFYIKLDRMRSLLGDFDQRGLNIRAYP